MAKDNTVIYIRPTLKEALQSASKDYGENQIDIASKAIACYLLLSSEERKAMSLLGKKALALLEAGFSFSPNGGFIYESESITLERKDKT